MHPETVGDSLATLIAEVSGQYPEQFALLAPGREPLTFSQLLFHLDNVAEQLSQWGITPQDRVAVSLPNGPQMATVFLGVARVASCAPLNPNYREPECEFYLSDLQPKALIVQPGIADAARAVALKLGIVVLEMSIPDNGPAGVFELKSDTPYSSEPSSQRGSPDDVALVLHTSGTTSRPKMVPLTQRNLCRSALNIADTLRLTSQDRCLNVMPLFHIHGLMGCLLSSISAGASIACTPGFDADSFRDWLKECQPTWFSAVPTMQQAALTQIQQGGLPDCPLRFVRSSSAAMPATVLAEIEKTYGVPLIEAYGMTEASHQMTSNPLPPAPRKPKSVGVAGKTQVAIAAADRNELLAQGEIGEVVICGGAVTQGYVSNPKANATAFFEDWFRTGDQGYLDEDGYLFLQGRLKEIINRGGEKISPLEIDEALMELPAVHQAVAFAMPHPTLGEDLAAAVVLKPDSTTTPRDLRDYLFERIADFKVPSQIILVEQIPKGATGKLQRIGLAEKLSSQLTADFVAPLNETEQAIAAVFQEILGCDRVGTTENFFVLGGDSLKGTQVTSRLSQQYGIELPNTQLFHCPTVVELAQEIERLTRDDAAIADLADELAGLSPEELEQLLAEAEG
ncbi:MAG: AMP-binding protein [Cyanobacteria bacterium P01_H01_bin.15]